MTIQDIVRVVSGHNPSSYQELCALMTLLGLDRVDSFSGRYVREYLIDGRRLIAVTHDGGHEIIWNGDVLWSSSKWRMRS
jgi:hypothetical protein